MGAGSHKHSIVVIFRERAHGPYTQRPLRNHVDRATDMAMAFHRSRCARTAIGSTSNDGLRCSLVSWPPPWKSVPIYVSRCRCAGCPSPIDFASADLFAA
jgi:hypothetical protein